MQIDQARGLIKPRRFKTAAQHDHRGAVISNLLRSSSHFVFFSSSSTFPPLPPLLSHTQRSPSHSSLSSSPASCHSSSLLTFLPISWFRWGSPPPCAPRVHRYYTPSTKSLHLRLLHGTNRGRHHVRRSRHRAREGVGAASAMSGSHTGSRKSRRSITRGLPPSLPHRSVHPYHLCIPFVGGTSDHGSTSAFANQIPRTWWWRSILGVAWTQPTRHWPGLRSDRKAQAVHG